MSFVVKGFDLPNSCADCPLEIDGRCGGLAGEPLPDGYLGKIDRPMFCPLVVAPEWISVEERLPEGKINPNTLDFEWVLCATVLGDVRAYKYGTPLRQKEAHFWHGFENLDAYVTHWMPLPEPPKEDKP